MRNKIVGNIVLIMLLVLVSCTIYYGMNDATIIEEEQTEEYVEPEGYREFLDNKPDLRPLVKESEWGRCGISDEAFVRYVKDYIKKWNIEIIKIRYITVDKLPAVKCIGFVLLYMKEPMAVYRMRKDKEKRNEKQT